MSNLHSSMLEISDRWVPDTSSTIIMFNRMCGLLLKLIQLIRWQSYKRIRKFKRSCPDLLSGGYKNSRWFAIVWMFLFIHKFYWLFNNCYLYSYIYLRLSIRIVQNKHLFNLFLHITKICLLIVEMRFLDEFTFLTVFQYKLNLQFMRSMVVVSFVPRSSKWFSFHVLDKFDD